MKFPRGQRAVSGCAAFDFDHTGRAEIRPGELFLARPDDFHRMAGGTSQTSSFHSSIAGMLPSVRGTRVGNDHAYGAFWNAEGGGKLVADGERALRAGPHGQLIVGPVG